MKTLVRPSNPEDFNFVFDTWLNEWRSNKYAGTIPNHLYFDTQRALIEELLRRGASINVACNADNHDEKLGWVCFELKDKVAVLHYMYVKDPYRNWPIAPLLLSSLPGDQPGFLTHKLNFKSLREWKHAPEIARRKTL